MTAFLSVKGENKNDDKEWNLFLSEQDGFSIEMPLNPETQEQVIPSEMGDLNLKIFMHKSQDNNADNMLYMVMRTEYPESFTVHRDSILIIEDFFQNAIYGALNQVNGNLLTEENIEYKEYPGKNVTISFQNGQVILNMRQYLVDNYVYVLQVMTPKDKQGNESITKFFESFKLLE